MGNYFSSSKNQSIQIINETDQDHVVVTNSTENLEKKNDHVTKIDETILKEDNQENSQNDSTSNTNTLNENSADADLKTNISTTDVNFNYVIQKKNLKRKNKKKNKKKYLQ